MEHTTHSPRRLFLIGLAAIIGLIGTLALVALVLVQSGAHENTAILPAETISKQIASADEVRQNVTDLNAALKQSANDQSAAKAAVNDKQVKVGS